MGDAISIEAYLFIEVHAKAYKFQFRDALTAVGNAEDNAVRIREPSINAHHVLFTWANGKFFLRRVEDSSVWLNGEKMESFSEELRFGDVIRIGDVRLRLVEGGSMTDTAVMFMVTSHVDESIRPWQLFVSRKTRIALGDAPADLLLPGGLPGTRVVIENYGPNAQYLVPPEKSEHPVYLNEEGVSRRVKLKDKDVIRVKGFTIRMRMMRGEVLEDPEGLLWIEAMRRYSVPEDTRS